jgi:hypothetical protein
MRSVSGGIYDTAISAKRRALQSVITAPSAVIISHFCLLQTIYLRPAEKGRKTALGEKKREKKRPSSHCAENAIIPFALHYFTIFQKSRQFC